MRTTWEIKSSKINKHDLKWFSSVGIEYQTTISTKDILGVNGKSFTICTRQVVTAVTTSESEETLLLLKFGHTAYMVKQEWH